jgi:hypothetical protein
VHPSPCRPRLRARQRWRDRPRTRGQKDLHQPGRHHEVHRGKHPVGVSRRLSTLIPLESGGQARIASPAHAGEVELVVAARQPRAFRGSERACPRRRRYHHRGAPLLNFLFFGFFFITFRSQRVLRRSAGCLLTCPRTFEPSGSYTSPNMWWPDGPHRDRADHRILAYLPLALIPPSRFPWQSRSKSCPCGGSGRPRRRRTGARSSPSPLGGTMVRQG